MIHVGLCLWTLASQVKQGVILKPHRWMICYCLLLLFVVGLSVCLSVCVLKCIRFHLPDTTAASTTATTTSSSNSLSGSGRHTRVRKVRCCLRNWTRCYSTFWCPTFGARSFDIVEVGAGLIKSHRIVTESTVIFKLLLHNNSDEGVFAVEKD